MLGWDEPIAGRRRRALVLLALAMSALLQGGCRADPWPLWTEYASRYVDGQGRVIDRQGADRTTSEGQAYAMFFALVANDRGRFDQLLTWTEDNLAKGDLTSTLPAWDWGRSPDGGWKVLDANSASDADLWMSYTLIEAGRLWREPRYDGLGRVMAARIARQEVANLPQFGLLLLPGQAGFHPKANIWVVNPSYSPIPLLGRLAEAMPGGPWRALAAQQPRMLRAGSSGGYAMDWMQYDSSAAPGNAWIPIALPPQATEAKASAAAVSGGVPAATAGGAPQTGNGGESAAQVAATGPRAKGAMGSYDAIRVYLWAGMTNPKTAGARECLDAFPAMARYLGTQPLPPAEVDSRGQILRGDGPVGFSAAVVPYLESLGLAEEAKAQLDRVAAMKNPATGLYGREQDYYDQNLALFAMGWADRRFRFEPDGRLKLAW